MDHPAWVFALSIWGTSAKEVQQCFGDKRVGDKPEG
jgi:hypothetical protein